MSKAQLDRIEAKLDNIIEKLNNIEPMQRKLVSEGKPPFVVQFPPEMIDWFKKTQAIIYKTD